MLLLDCYNLLVLSLESWRSVSIFHKNIVFYVFLVLKFYFYDASTCCIIVGQQDTHSETTSTILVHESDSDGNLWWLKQTQNTETDLSVDRGKISIL